MLVLERVQGERKADFVLGDQEGWSPNARSKPGKREKPYNTCRILKFLTMINCR